MVAYLATGWLTFILAGVAGWYRLWKDVEKFKKRRAKAKTVGPIIERECND